MVYLSLGLMIYCLLLIGCYIYFFLEGGKDITNEFGWILIHEWLGHVVLYTTFYSYLRIKRHHNMNDNISGNKNIGPRLSVTRNKQTDKYLKYHHYHHNSKQNNLNPNVNKIINGGTNKYYQQSNDDHFADDDMSDYRKYHPVHRDSRESDQTEIMSISANDEQQQQYNSYKNMQYGGMSGMLPPSTNLFSPNSQSQNNSNQYKNSQGINSKSLYDRTNYENFLI